jgi:hypothetical protein
MITKTCPGCGKEFQRPKWKHRIYCSSECYHKHMVTSPPALKNGAGNSYTKMAWNAFNRMISQQDIIKLPGRVVRVHNAACYLKEARAILEGKKKGINHCVKLEGD